MQDIQSKIVANENERLQFHTVTRFFKTKCKKFLKKIQNKNQVIFQHNKEFIPAIGNC